jgi:hypothetical protein
VTCIGWASGLLRAQRAPTLGHHGAAGVDVRAMVVDRIAAGLAGAQSYRRAVEVACELAPDVSRRMMML